MHGSNFALSDTRVSDDAVDGRFRYMDDVATAAAMAQCNIHVVRKGRLGKLDGAIDICRIHRVNADLF